MTTVERGAQPEHPGVEHSASISGVLLPLITGALGLFEAAHTMICSGFRFIHTDPGDARHLNYILEHSYRWLVRDPAHHSLWTLPIFYPVPNTGAYSEMLLGVAPFYIPWRLIGLAPDTSLQAWTVTVLLLNFMAAYVLFRRSFGYGVAPASLASFLFAYGAPRVLKLGHAHLLPQFFTVTALISLVELFRPRAGAGDGRRDRLWIGFFFASLVAQFYAGFYLGWFFALALGCAVVLALARARFRQPLLKVVLERFLFIGFCGAASVLALWPLYDHYHAAAAVVGFRSYADVRPFLPPLKAWLNPGPYSWLYSRLASLPVFSTLPFEWEKRYFFGWITMGVSGYGLVLARKKTSIRLILLAAIATVGIATAWPGGFTFWHMVFVSVPGARAMRAVSRVLLLVLIPASLGLATAVERLLKRGSGQTVAVLFALVMAEQGQTMPSYDKLATRRQVAAIESAIPPACSAFYYSPVGRVKPAWESQLDAMWAGLGAGIPTINGYSSNLPPGWNPLFDDPVEARDEPRLRKALTAWSRKESLRPGSFCWIQLPAVKGLPTGSNR